MTTKEKQLGFERGNDGRTPIDGTIELDEKLVQKTQVITPSEQLFGSIPILKSPE